MLTGIFARAVGKATLIMTILVPCTTPAWASITYDYAQDWMFDSASGLYWQVLPIPASTFVPSTGTIATYQQAVDLGAQVGLTGGLFDLSANSPPGAYSLPLANLLSFFQSDAPAQSNPTRQPNLFVSALYDYGSADPPPNSYGYTAFSYSKVDATSTSWTYIGQTTIGSYGPDNPCPAHATGGACPATALGFVVASAQPVPLPAALWLMLSGLGGLGLLRCQRKI